MSSLNPVFTVGQQICEPLRQAPGPERARRRWRAPRRCSTRSACPSRSGGSRAYPHELSGGQQQRVMIAMALACEPKLLIADEPTTALDVTIQRQILELLARLKAQHRMSMLFISHDLGVVGEIADHVVVMRQGTVREQGPVARIFAAPQDAYTQALLACRPTLEQRRAAADGDRRPHRAARSRRRQRVGKPKDPDAPVVLEAQRADQELLAAQRRVRPQASSRPCKGVELPAAPRPHARRRRRVGLGQDDDGPGAAAPARAERRAGGGQVHVRRPATCWR